MVEAAEGVGPMAISQQQLGSRASTLRSEEDLVMPYYTAIVTLVSVAFYFFLATRVAVAHGKFDVIPTALAVDVQHNDPTPS